MAQKFNLQIVLDLMQERADEATRELGRLIAAEKSEKEKLLLLQQYRDEYSQRFLAAARNGLSTREWRNYQDFLDRIDQAIEQQKKTVSTSKEDTVAGQDRWQEQNVKLKAFDTLSQRFHSQEAVREAKREQKITDEIAARRREGKGEE
ncbi:MAG: flagellar export protein FliJ [Betaproteobacteria bacterium]|nr:flagellar export protein FliJ [Betaproteobacteria bacterium]